jgi:hypothetical protein
MTESATAHVFHVMGADAVWVCAKNRDLVDILRTVISTELVLMFVKKKLVWIKSRDG